MDTKALFAKAASAQNNPAANKRIKKMPVFEFICFPFLRISMILRKSHDFK